MRTREEDLCDLIAARKINQCTSDIIALQNPGFDMQIAREVQMLLHRLPICFRQSAQVASGLYSDSEAFRTQKVAHTLRAPYDHRRFRIGRHQRENLVVLAGGKSEAVSRENAGFSIDHAMFDFVRRLPERKLS